MVVATNDLMGLTNFANPNALRIIQNFAVGTTHVASKIILSISEQAYRFNTDL
jgi:hypothetical protein